MTKKTTKNNTTLRQFSLVSRLTVVTAAGSGRLLRRRRPSAQIIIYKMNFVRAPVSFHVYISSHLNIVRQI